MLMLCFSYQHHTYRREFRIIPHTALPFQISLSVLKERDREKKFCVSPQLSKARRKYVMSSGQEDKISYQGHISRCGLERIGLGWAALRSLKFGSVPFSSVDSRYSSP